MLTGAVEAPTLPLVRQRSAAFVAFGIMVSAWLIVKAFVAFAPFTSCAHVNSSLPLLLDATAEELTLGLEKGQFTSVDLVQVSHETALKLHEEINC